MPKTILSHYKIKDLVEILNIDPLKAKALKTDPNETLTLKQFQMLSPTLPETLIKREIVLARKRSRSPVSKYRLPKSIDSLSVEILTPPKDHRTYHTVKVFYKRKRSDHSSLKTDVPVDDAGLILKNLFEQAEFRQSPFSDPRREAIRRDEAGAGIEIRAELREVFGEEYEMFRDLFLKEDYRKFYDTEIPVRKNMLSYYSIITQNEPNYGRDRFPHIKEYSDFADFETINTANHHFIPEVIERLTDSYRIHYYKNNSLQIWTKGFLQLMAVGKILHNEIVFCYPVKPGTDEHLFFSTPFIYLYSHDVSLPHAQEVKIFLTPGIKFELIPDSKRENIKNAHRVLINNRRWTRAVITQEELEDKLQNPTTYRQRIPDFTKYKDHVLWMR